MIAKCVLIALFAAVASARPDILGGAVFGTSSQAGLIGASSVSGLVGASAPSVVVGAAAPSVAVGVATPSVVVGSSSPSSLVGASSVSGLVGASSGAIVGSSSGISSGAVTRNLVAPGKYPVALRTCGPTPDQQIPVTTTRVTAPVQVKPTVRLPARIPGPRTVAHSCTCQKTILRPRVNQQIITVPSVQSYIETTSRPVIENIQYEAVPVNCQGSSGAQFVEVGAGSLASSGSLVSSGSVGLVSSGSLASTGSLGVVSGSSFGTPVQAIQVPQVQTVQAVQVPQVQTVQAVQVPQVQTVQAVQVPQTLSLGSSSFRTTSNIF